MFSKAGFIQIFVCLFIILVNNVLWIKMQRFSVVRHCVHYYITCLTLLACTPRPEFPRLTDTKFILSNLSNNLQLLLITQTFAISRLHQWIVLLTSLVYMSIVTLSWF